MIPVNMSMLLKNSFNAVLQNTVKGFTPFYANCSVSTTRKFSAEVRTADPSLDDDEEALQLQARERSVEFRRNVSRLNLEHRNMVHEQVPFPEPKAQFHETVKYRRKMYGKYGSVSGVNPGIMWPTKEDIEERKEYERVAYPFTIQEMVREELSKIEAEEAKIWERQNQIKENFKKLNKWVDDLESRRAKKIKVAADAKAKNDKLVEEVRRHFGYSVDHRDERFQQMLEQKIKEDKKQAKIERKKKRDEMLMKDLIDLAEKQEK